MGSRAFGLATEESDTDRRGVYVAPTPWFWGFSRPPTHLDGPEEERFSWELERFCALALRANPNILECLHSPSVEYADPRGEELLSLRDAFLSQEVLRTFSRYAAGQRRKLEADVRTHGAPRWKHAMHLLRLQRSCRDLLRTGRLGPVRRIFVEEPAASGAYSRRAFGSPSYWTYSGDSGVRRECVPGVAGPRRSAGQGLVVGVGEAREELLAVRRGEWSWERVTSAMADLDAACEEAALTTPLPAAPDRARGEDFLYRVRRDSAAALG
ncbi:DNA polymerase beta superfamily protein [Streptomyces sp. NPDC058373]|uniref:nucleotidyltransferase domain-containing protein n=1 Tax=Streptomyces sp. NPDC058373 TaxID=3346465 RepID=UPI0036518593